MKKIFALVLALALTALCTACGGKSGNALPVLEADGKQLSFAESMDSVKEKFPKAEKSSLYGYTFKTAGGEDVIIYFLDDTVSGWRTSAKGTGISGGLKVGDPYEDVLKTYPEAVTNNGIKALTSGKEEKKYDPEKDVSETYFVYMDSDGKAYHYMDYKAKEKEDYDKTHEIDLSGWFRLEIKVKGTVIADIKFINAQELHEMNSRFR